MVIDTSFHLIILSKYPKGENVKTRLAKTIGKEAASMVMEALLLDLYYEHANQEYSLSICAPCQDKRFKEKFSKLLPEALIEYYGNALRGKDSQLNHIFSDKLKNHTKVVAICSDTPGVSRKIVMEAYNALEKTDAVIGPDSGSGYYLIGLKKEIDIFTSLSQERSPYLDKTLELLNLKEVNYAIIGALPDLDYIDDVSKIDWDKIKGHWKRTIKVLNILGLPLLTQG